jgi:glutamate carboxypeptidase
MANDAAPVLAWIEQQQPRMRQLIIQWAVINSGSHNLDGLDRFSRVLQQHYSALGGEMTEIPLPPQHVIDNRGDEIDVPLGRALAIRKRPDAPRRVFLGIHMDTVYRPDDLFQSVEQVDANTLRGPGVVDAKGGLVVMLIALEALERTPIASRIGWEVLINPDEEIGSPGSAELFAQAARRNNVGLAFEPTFPDGALVGERKGSGNYSVVFRGRSAHAGRDFQAGRNAVLAAAEFAVAANRINGTLPDVTLNVGRIDGGGPVNVVPDRAVCRLNARASDPNHPPQIESELRRIAAEISARQDVGASVHGQFLSPPKPLDAPTLSLLELIAACGRELGMSLAWRSSGGASDGNKLAAAGLPVVDTMGPRGGNLHSPQEYLLLDSLAERAKLAALVLMRLAEGQIAWPASGD